VQDADSSGSNGYPEGREFESLIARHLFFFVHRHLRTFLQVRVDGYNWVQHRVSYNAGVVNYFFRTPLLPLKEERHFALFEKLAIPTKARS